MPKQADSSKKPHSGEASPTRVPDRFMQTLRKTLENIHDSEWLDKNSPLTAVLFAGVDSDSARRRQIILTGLSEVDTLLRSVWHFWEERKKTPLQALLWEAVCHLPPDLDTHNQAVLILTYFQDPRPKQVAVINLLAIGRSTYYRYLDQAVETLGLSLVKLLRPALRLEKPVPRPLNRDAGQYAEASAALEQALAGFQRLELADEVHITQEILTFSTLPSF